MDIRQETAGTNECQLNSLKNIAEGNARTPPATLMRHLKLAVRRRLTSRQDRILHQNVNVAIDWFCSRIGKNAPRAQRAVNAQQMALEAGDLVRVRSKEEIASTLNHLGQAKGCTFISDTMTPYCNTVHRVLKSMERFVDERDLRVKKCKGLVLLEGVMCGGTTAFGRCDRSCYIFWREEWLEKLE